MNRAFTSNDFYTSKKQIQLSICFFQTGNDLLSRAASRQVSSAQRSLTTVFEMGTGVASPLSSLDSRSPFSRYPKKDFASL